jgi:hypothetical protein
VEHKFTSRAVDGVAVSRPPVEHKFTSRAVDGVAVSRPSVEHKFTSRAVDGVAVSRPRKLPNVSDEGFKTAAGNKGVTGSCWFFSLHCDHKFEIKGKSGVMEKVELVPVMFSGLLVKLDVFRMEFELFCLETCGV